MDKMKLPDLSQSGSTTTTTSTQTMTPSPMNTLTNTPTLTATPTKATPTPLGGAPECLEVGSKINLGSPGPTSPSAGVNNGALTLWIDGVPQETVSGIDNDTLRLDTGTTGTEFFDAFYAAAASSV